MLGRIVWLLLVIIALGAASIGWWTGRSTTAEPSVYVSLGASDAVGVGATQPAEGWVPRVHASLPASTQLLNLGISGATLGEIVRAELPPAIDARPRWVTLWAGVNDLRAGVALPTFVDQLDQALQPFATQQPRPVILILNIPDLRQLPAFAGRAPADVDTTVQRWNNAIAEAAQRHGAILVDLYAHSDEITANPAFISADGFHPSSAGYERIAGFVVSALRRNVSAQ